MAVRYNLSRRSASAYGAFRLILFVAVVALFGGGAGAAKPEPADQAQATPPETSPASPEQTTRTDQDRATGVSKPVNAKWVASDRATLALALDEARVDLNQARLRATTAIRRSQWYQQADAEVRSLERKLEDARQAGTPNEKLAASTAWNRARAELEQREAEELQKDQGLTAAYAAELSASRELDQFDRDEARKRAEREAMAAAERQRLIEPGDDGRSYGGDSSGGDVHVKGYTRKDGTYVAPHTRSRPDGIRSNNRSSSRGGRGR